MLVYHDGAFAGAASSFGVLHTQTNFAGTSYTWTVAAGVPTTGVAGANPVSPYNIAWFAGTGTAQPTEYRLVGCGVRARYTGTELEKGGRMICYRARMNTNVTRTGGTDASVLLGDLSQHTSPIDRQWKMVSYLPSNAEDISYATQADWNASERYVLIIYVDGTTPLNGFEFEARAYYELVGPGTQVTPSHSDPVGFGAIMSSVPQQVKEAGQSMFNSMYNLAGDAIRRTSTNLLTYATGAAIQSRLAGRQPLRLTL
jgi:hypothetical protein